MEKIRKIKENMYMALWNKKLCEEKIQFIVEYEGNYLIEVSEWLTKEEIKDIDLSKYDFMKWTEYTKKAGEAKCI